MRWAFFLLALAGAAHAESYRDLMARKPDLFDARTGMRILRYQAPLATDIPGGAQVADYDRLVALMDAGASAIFPPGTVIAEAAQGLLDKLSSQLGHSRDAAE